MLEMMTASKVVATKMDYPTFLSWLSTRNIPTAAKTANMTNMAGKYSQASLDTTGQLLMYGSSYGNHMTADSLIHAVMLHACPTRQIADEIRANSRVCLYLVSAVTSFPSYTALDRNGYVSRSYTTFQGTTLQDFVYYDASLGYMMRYNASVPGAIPVAFDGKLKSL